MLRHPQSLSLAAQLWSHRKALSCQPMLTFLCFFLLNWASIWSVLLQARPRRWLWHRMLLLLPCPVAPVTGLVPVLRAGTGQANTAGCKINTWVLGSVWELKILTAKFGADFVSFLTPAPGCLLPAPEPATLSPCPDSPGMVPDAAFCGSSKGWQMSSTAPNLLGSASKRLRGTFPPCFPDLPR